MFYLVSDQRHKDLGREVEPKTQYQVILFSPRNVASLGISTSFLFFLLMQLHSQILAACLCGELFARNDGKKQKTQNKATLK